MRSTVALAAIAIGMLAACDSPSAQSPPEDNLINATDTDQAFPSQATGNDIITGDDATQGGSGNAAGGNQQESQQQGPPPQ
jgi:hypothetical protein